jgi:predicted nuclease of predicted toxin-antitoxin system
VRFVVDECTGPAVAEWLRARGHEVFSVYEEARGIGDDAVISAAYYGDYILVTNDKDFGEKVYRERRPHKGIVPMRLDDERAANKVEVLRRLLEAYADRLAGHFVVVTERRVRFARM